MPLPSLSELRRAYSQHWPDYLAEAMGVVLFMIASCGTAVLFHHPDSPVRQFLGESTMLRRAVQALVVCVFMLVINFNPAGKRSGSHINPAVTLAFRYLGKISAANAFWYILFQCLAAVLSGLIFYQLFKPWYPHPDVNYNLNTPKSENGGWPVAFLAEFIISALLMLVTLITLHSRRFSQHSSYFTIGLIMLYIVFEAPFSGMSTNPARSLGTAVGALNFSYFWIYVVAPLSAMFLATLAFQRWWKPKTRQTDQAVQQEGCFTTDSTPPNFPIVNSKKQ